jgi:hypothetical protein
MDRQASQVVGLAVTYTLTPGGASSGSKVDGVGRDLSGPMTEQVTMLLQMTDQLAMPLPAKPLGAGAVWKHRKTIQQNQLTLVSTTTVELVALEGTIATFKSTTEMTGADQTITQGSASAKVTNIHGSGSASGKLDLAKAVVHGETRATLEFQMIVDGATRPTKLDMTTRFGPRAPAPAHEDPDSTDTNTGSDAPADAATTSTDGG